MAEHLSRFPVFGAVIETLDYFLRDELQGNVVAVPRAQLGLSTSEDARAFLIKSYVPRDEFENAAPKGSPNIPYVLSDETGKWCGAYFVIKSPKYERDLFKDMHTRLQAMVQWNEQLLKQERLLVVVDPRDDVIHVVPLM